MNRIGLVDQGKWEVYDGAHVALNCTDIIKTQFSINAALLSEGAAFMYNQVNNLSVPAGSPTSRVDLLSLDRLGQVAWQCRGHHKINSQDLLPRGLWEGRVGDRLRDVRKNHLHD
jgi:hypothetical protein